MQSESSLQRRGSMRRALGGGKPLSLGGIARTAVGVLAPALFICVLAWPMLFTDKGFNPDWVKHLWDVWHQGLAIRANLHPTLFLNYPQAVFYPQYAFYGGTLFVILGTLSLLAGNAPIEIYVLAYLACFASAYGGWYWMARMAGLRSWVAHVPGIVFLTSSYYLTLVYARGDLPEFTGVSMIPLMVASALSILRADRLRIWPALALTVSSIFFFGSHSLTVIWGTTFLVVSAVAVIAFIPQTRQWLTWRGGIRLGVLVIPAFLLSAWFLLPALAYQAHTEISTQYAAARESLRVDNIWVSVEHLFTLSRAPATYPHTDFALSLPVAAMLWTLVVILLAWWGRVKGPWRRMLMVCAVLAALFTVVMTHAGLILALPKPFAILQYSYRLESYINLAVTGAVLAALVVVQRTGRRTRLWIWALIPVLAVSLVGAIQEADAHPNDGGRLAGIEVPEPSHQLLEDYIDVDQPIWSDTGPQPPRIEFPAASIHDERVSKVVHLRPGQLVLTNIGGGPEFVHISGAKIVGIDQKFGNAVLRIGPSTTRAQTGSNGANRWTEVISVSPASSLSLALGRILSVLAALFLIGVFVVLAVRRSPVRRDA